jgi:hypothetical protein
VTARVTLGPPDGPAEFSATTPASGRPHALVEHYLRVGEPGWVVRWYVPADSRDSADGERLVTPPCDVVFIHGPGHQSTTRCAAVGEHTEHHADCGNSGYQEATDGELRTRELRGETRRVASVPYWG